MSITFKPDLDHRLGVGFKLNLNRIETHRLMKVSAFSLKPFEQEALAKGNKKKHQVTIISYLLSLETADFSEGKKAVVVFSLGT